MWEMNPSENRIYLFLQILKFVIKMEQKIKVEPSEELAYWVGAMQTDGSFWKYYRKEKRHFEFRLAMGVATKSLPMLQKVVELSAKIFKRYGKAYKRDKEDQWDYYIQVKQLSQVFEKLDIKFGDPPIPPEWVLYKPKFFGAYLAGVIDGDGSVRVSKRKSPQCFIKITSGSRQVELSESIKQILKCGVYQKGFYQKKFIKSWGRTVEGTWYISEFCVSSKTAKFIADFVIPHLQLIYKKERLEDFIEKRYSLLNLKKSSSEDRI